MTATDQLHDRTDELLARIADFAGSIEFDQIPAAVVQGAKERLIDSVGCALGAQVGTRTCETARIGEAIAPQPTAPHLAGRIIGTDSRVAADAAAFVNGCLIRDLDFNDTYPGHHPSDCLGGILAVAPVVGATGKDLITAMVISYEISIRLLKAAKLNRLGWDNGYSTGIGATAAVARLMGLGREQIRHAIAITATANVPMRATRAGQLSMWKGAATAYSVRNAVFSAQLAGHGMTGPEAPFTGRHGLIELITGPIDLDPFGSEGGDYLLPLAKIKYWPVVYNMQALVWAGRQLRTELNGRMPTGIDVFTYWSAWRESGSEPAKWDPRTRETADHSAPYILARAMRDGEINEAAFEPSAFLDESIRQEMKLITVAVADDIEAAYPDTIRMRVQARDGDGGTYEITIENPLGHETNQMSPADIEQKFRSLCSPSLTEAVVDEALRAWWNIEDRTVDLALDLVSLRSS